MTAIAIWFNNESPQAPSLWVASDSRISKHKEKTPLIDDAAKVFALPVVCRSPDANGFFSQTCHSHAYGYCFAGNTLLGQNTFIAAMPLLGNLIASQPYAPPISCVADFVLTYLSRAFDDYKVIACEYAAVEVALFGWCHRTEKPHIFHFYPVKDDSGEYTIKRDHLTDLKHKSFVYLGDERVMLTEKIQKAFDCSPEAGRPLARIPRYVIEDHILDENYKTIGGDLQLGVADRTGFQQYSICKPKVHGQPEACLSYLGHELDQDIPRVGEAYSGLPGMT
jgi:hypothetical protein